MNAYIILAAGVLLGALAGFIVAGNLHYRTERKLRAQVRALKAGGKAEETNTTMMILTIIAVFLLAFILTMIVVFCVKGSVPDTLIQYTLGAGGVEALLLAAIKISKVIKGHKAEPEMEPETGNTDDAPVG